MNGWRVTQIDPHLDLIDLGIGQPDFALLPVELIEQAAAERLARRDPSYLNYGYEMGDEGLRAALADLMTRRSGAPTRPEELMITSGASQALDLICTLLTQAGDTVFVEEPSYFLALRILADHRLTLVGIPAGEAGLDLDALEERLQRERPVFLYTIPTFQNPSGVTLPAVGRRRLVELSQTYNFTIVADEVYHLLDYGASPPPPLAAAAGDGAVISLNSFSKILAPGLRLGWVKAAPPLLTRLAGSGLVDSGGGLNPFTSAVVRAAVGDGRLEGYIDRLRTIYAGRIDTMDQALRRHFGGRIRCRRPAGGYFFWLQLVDGGSGTDRLAAARAAGVSYQPGEKFSSQGGFQDYLRLSFAFYGEERLVEGVERLARALG